MTDKPPQRHPERFRQAQHRRAGGAAHRPAAGSPPDIPHLEMLEVLEFLELFRTEINATFYLSTPDPHLTMSIHLIRSHLEARPVTATSLVAASGVPYATGRRRLDELIAAGLVEQRPRTRTGKTFSLHPSVKLMETWSQACGRLRRLGQKTFGCAPGGEEVRDYYYGGSYMETRTIQPPRVVTEPLDLPGGLRILVHGDPTFMVMEKLKRRFEQVIGCDIHQRAFSIDRLHGDILTDANRRQSRYDIVAVDLPWIGEFAERGILTPIDVSWTLRRWSRRTFIPRVGSRRITAAGRMACPARPRRNCCSIAAICSPRPAWRPRAPRTPCCRRRATYTTRRTAATASPGTPRAAPRSGTPS